MTREEAIDIAARELSEKDAFSKSEAIYTGSLSGEWLVTFEKEDGTQVHYSVYSNGTISRPGLVISAYPPRFDRGWGWRFTLPLLGYTGAFIGALIVVYRLLRG